MFYCLFFFFLHPGNLSTYKVVLEESGIFFTSSISISITIAIAIAISVISVSISIISIFIISFSIYIALMCYCCIFTSGEAEQQICPAGNLTCSRFSAFA